MRRHRAFWAVPLLVVVLIVGACGGDEEQSTDARLAAVASLEVFADMVRNVGGDRVEVKALLPPGADPHTYELAPNRVAEIVRADVVFINGLALEESTEEVIRNNAAAAVVELAEGLNSLGDNPHLWLDLRLAARYAERIRDALIAQDPDGREEYEANAEAYLEQLADLDREMEDAVASIPVANRKLVTFHDAFPYLASRYGLEVVAVVVRSPGQEPSARDVAELADKLRSEQVPAVFVEPQSNSRVLEQAADDADVRVLELLSGALTDDVDSYVELMRFNMRQLQEGLGGD